MLDKEVFKAGMQDLTMSYPNWKLDVTDSDTMRFWYERFKAFGDDRFIYMVDQYIASNDFNPTIAGLNKCDTLPRKSYTQIAHEKMLAEHEARKEKENART